MVVRRCLADVLDTDGYKGLRQPVPFARSIHAQALRRWVSLVLRLASFIRRSPLTGWETVGFIGRGRSVIQMDHDRRRGWLFGLTQSGRFFLRKRLMDLHGVRLAVKGSALISMSCLMMENNRPPEAGGVSIIGRHKVRFEFHQISNGIPMEFHWNFRLFGIRQTEGFAD